ncbi:MAG: FGGY-family carbohydrate kinase [Peptococcaceae bacterium]
MGYLMGIDAGTSSLKIVLFDLQGNEICRAAKKNTIIHKNGNWSELDMNQLWRDCFTSIKGMLTDHRINPGAIKGIGVTGQGEGCWLADKKGNPGGPAILWSDGRAGEIVAALKNKGEINTRIKDITGSYIFPGAASVLLKWLQIFRRENLSRADYCFFCKDWLRFKLTGEAYLEVTDASTSLLDLADEKISPELLEILEIKECLRLFPPIKKSYQLAGYITKAAGELTGLKAGTPVAAGMMDIVATSLGNGTVSIGDSCTILGTTCCNAVLTDSYHLRDNSLSGFECHSIDKLYLNVIAAMAGTLNLDWAVENLWGKERGSGDEELFGLLEEKIRDIPPGSGGIIYHPYISLAGERAPFYDPHACAQFFGISAGLNKYNLLKAVYEGVAFSIKDCLAEACGPGKIYLGGGGSRSHYWAQLISDCTGKEVILSAGSEFAAKGAALAAGTAVGIFVNLQEAARRTFKLKKQFAPDQKNTRLYDSLFQIYRGLRETNRELWQLRREVMQNNFE